MAGAAPGGHRRPRRPGRRARAGGGQARGDRPGSAARRPRGPAGGVHARRTVGGDPRGDGGRARPRCRRSLAGDLALAGCSRGLPGGLHPGGGRRRRGGRPARCVRRHGIVALGAAVRPGQRRDPHPTGLDRGRLRQRADRRRRGDRGLPQWARHRPGLGGARRAGAGRPGRRPGDRLAAPGAGADRHGPDRRQRVAGLPGHPTGRSDRRRGHRAAPPGRRRCGRHPGRDGCGRRGRLGQRVGPDHRRCSGAGRRREHRPGGAGRRRAARPGRPVADGGRARARRPARAAPRVRRHQPLRRRGRRLLRRHRRGRRGRRRGLLGRGPPAAGQRGHGLGDRGGLPGPRAADTSARHRRHPDLPRLRHRGRVARARRGPAAGCAVRRRRGLGTPRQVRRGLRGARPPGGDGRAVRRRLLRHRRRPFHGLQRGSGDHADQPALRGRGARRPGVEGQRRRGAPTRGHRHDRAHGRRPRGHHGRQRRGPRRRGGRDARSSRSSPRLA